MRCLLPNRPPSPNTFYENWWAPEFTYMLQNRLEKVAMSLEPSKRIWWREEFGGCAPDREPLDSEILHKYEDRGNVLRTSPPACEDQPQVSHQGQNSTNGLLTPWSSPDETPTVPRQPRPPKSPTHYIPDKFPALHFPSPGTRKALQRKPKVYTAEEDEELLQSALRQREANDLERQRLYGIPLKRGKDLPSKSSPSISQRDQCAQTPSNAPNQDKSSKLEEHHQVKQSPTDDYPKRLRQDWSFSPPLLAHGKIYPDDQRETVFRRPSVRPKVRSPKSPTHYIPDKFPALHFPSPGTRKALQRKPKVYTAEEEEQFLQSALRKQKLQIEQLRLWGFPVNKVWHPPAENSSSQSDRVEKAPTNSPTQDKASKPEGHQQLKQSLHQKIQAMNLRRSQRHGITIHHSENASPAISHSVSHVDPFEEELFIGKRLPASGELRRLKPSLSEKTEAMRLRRSHRHGTAIHRSEASVPIGSDTFSRHVEVKEESSKIETQPRSCEASPQEPEPSLWKKVEALKQRLSRRQGTAIYRAEEARDQVVASPSTVDQVPAVLLGTQVHEQSLMLERPPNVRVQSCQDFKAIKLGRSGCQGTARSV